MNWPIFRTALVACAILAATASSCRAEYPDRAVHILMPFPPGGAVDVVVRVVTDRMTAHLGRQFVIENRSGAGGVIATDAAAKSAPDGYVLLAATPNLTINAALQVKLPYDTEKDLTPVSIMAEVPELLVSYPGAPFRNFKGFVDYARAHPHTLNYASAGVGTLPHITMEVLLNRTGIKVTHVPYRGAAPAMADLLGGHVQLKLDTYTTSAQHIETGKLVALGTASRKRSSLIPNVPTVAELGLPGYEGILWIGFLAPAGTPKAIVDKLASAVARSVHEAKTVERLKVDGVDTVGGTPEEFRQQIAREIVQWRDVGRSSNIKLDQ